MNEQELPKIGHSLFAHAGCTVALSIQQGYHVMQIRFSGTLLRFVNFQKTLKLDAATVEDALAIVAQDFPQARQVIYDGEGKVRRVHQIFLNGKQLASGELGTTVAPSDCVELLTAIAGG